MVRTEVGEIVILVKKKGTFSNKREQYLFTPSFENLSKLGEPEDIIKAYSVLVANDAQETLIRCKHCFNDYTFKKIKQQLKNQLLTAKKILSCCCKDDISQIVKPISNDKILMLAKTLMDFGMIGMAKVRVSQRNQRSSYTSEFKINDYINNARVHLGLSLEESKSLTMTEYIMLMASKYPDNDGFTKEEYDNVMDDYEKRRAERLSKSQATK